MEALIAKRYVKALLDGATKDETVLYKEVFDGLSRSFSIDKFSDIMLSVYVDSDTKKEILLSAVSGAKNKKINNLVSLLSEKNRIDIIPAIAEELRVQIAAASGKYSGFIYSDEDIDDNLVKKLSQGLKNRTKTDIDLTFKNSDYKGIKIEADDLGIELSFSK